MDFSFKCHRCGTRNHSAVENIGTMIRCAECGIELEVPLTAFSSGMVEGEYWVHQKVGTGSVSEVYVTKLLSTANGEEEDANKLFMKVMSPLATVDQVATENFFHSICQSGKVVHPNVLSVTDTGIMKGHYFAVTPYVKGECVDSIIERDGPLSEQDALKICLRVAKLMQQVWNENRLVHQALKPANILMNKDGEVFLLDLGNSKQCLVPADGRLEAINPKGNLFDYMSPAQIQNLPDPDPTSDIYSLGASLHFMICGEKPYTDTMTSSIVQKHLWSPPPQLEAYNKKVSGETADLVRWMMGGSDGEDYRTWEELIAKIRPIYKKLSGGEADSTGSRPKIRQMTVTKNRKIKRRPTESHGSTPVIQPNTQSGGSPLAAILAVIVLMASLAGGAIWWVNTSDDPSVNGSGPRPTPTPKRSPAPVPVSNRLGDTFLETQLEQARSIVQQEPGSADTYVLELEGLLKRTKDKKQLETINASIAKLKSYRDWTNDPRSSGGGSKIKPSTTGESPSVSHLAIYLGDDKPVKVLDGKSLSGVVTGKTLKVNIYAICNGGTQSAKTVVEGTKYEKLDTNKPYTIGKSSSSIYLESGTYTITSTPFSDKHGKAGAGKTVKVKLVLKKAGGAAETTTSSVGVTGIQFVDAKTNKVIGPIREGFEISLKKYPEFSFLATVGQNVQKVEFVVTGNGLNHKQAESNAPYAAWGDSGNGNYAPAKNIQPGTYKVTATAYGVSRGNVLRGKPLTLTFTVKGEVDDKKSQNDSKPPTVGVVELRLFDIAKKRDLGMLKNNQKISLKETPQFTIFAVAKGEKVNSVSYTIAGKGQPSEMLSSGAPYAVWGKKRRSYRVSDLRPGTYTITATGCIKGRRSKKAVGKPLTLTFKVE